MAPTKNEPTERPILFSGQMVKSIIIGDKTETRRVKTKDKCPFGEPGDLLWVRETWKPTQSIALHLSFVRYRADDTRRIVYHEKGGDYSDNWRPSIFMPRWACRLVLKVTDIRLQQLDRITDADAIAEGFGACGPRDAFIELWNKLNAKRGYAWYTNPWVWVVRFEKFLQIDTELNPGPIDSQKHCQPTKF